METKNKLKSLFTEHWKYMAVSAACKLNLFDHLQEEKTAKQLAKELSLNEEKLLLLLNALRDSDFLDKNSNFFSLNSLSVFLTENNPESLKYACLNWSSEHLNAWQSLDFSIKTGKSSFEKIYGLPFFDYLIENPEKLQAYHKAMFQYAKDDYKALPNVIDFSVYKTVADVGGGTGAVANIIAEANPDISCLLFDLPEVIQLIPPTSNHRITLCSGNFFEPFPFKVDAIVLSRVLHDWDSEKASNILKNCKNALNFGGKVYIIEIVENEVTAHLLSLNMLAMCQSYERTYHEYQNLVNTNDLQILETKNLNSLQKILICQ